MDNAVETKQFPAIATVHTPTGPVDACDKHARDIRGLMQFLGCHVGITPSAAGAQCSNCVNEASVNANLNRTRSHCWQGGNMSEFDWPPHLKVERLEAALSKALKELETQRAANAKVRQDAIEECAMVCDSHTMIDPANKFEDGWEEGVFAASKAIRALGEAVHVQQPQP